MLITTTEFTRHRVLDGMARLHCSDFENRVEAPLAPRGNTAALLAAYYNDDKRLNGRLVAHEGNAAASEAAEKWLLI